MKVTVLPSQKHFKLIYEFVVSDDGENLATVVEDESSQRFLWINETLIEEPFERINFLNFTPKGDLIAVVQKDGLWTVFFKDSLWEERFDYVWNLKTDTLGETVAVNVKQEESYSVCVNGDRWESSFHDVRDLYISKTGKLIATYVKVEAYPVLDIFNFSKGIWSLAINQEVWEKKFISVFGCCFNPDESSVAVAVRLSDRRFSIAVDGVIWEESFVQVWEPVFLDEKSVVAPVKTEKGWQLFKDGHPLWKRAFFQLWNIRIHQKSKKIAGVAATDLGEWSVVVDERLWKSRFNQVVLPPVFSEDGQKIAAVFKHNDKWGIAVNDRVWENTFERVGTPIFNSDGNLIAVRGEKNNKFFIYVNDKKLDGPYDYLWDPVFKNLNTLIIKGIIQNKYYKKEIAL